MNRDKVFVPTCASLCWLLLLSLWVLRSLSVLMLPAELFSPTLTRHWFSRSHQVFEVSAFWNSTQIALPRVK
jgi:hypothetical protein